ncbi:MAG TPA: glycosyltransferase [Candidatus Limnocylindrales bacterium]
MNLIDGSSIWLQSTAEVLAGAGCEVTLVLKARVRTERLLEPLAHVAGLRIVRPFEDGLQGAPDRKAMPPAIAVEVLRELDRPAPFDLVVIRGRRLAAEAAASGAFNGRLWTYLTDIPQSEADLDPAAAEGLRRITDASRFLLCQTEELRSFIETGVDGAAGRCVLFPPVIPVPEEAPEVRPIERDRPLRLVYAGKFAPRWNTLEMTTLPEMLAERGIPAELEMIGDKIHADPVDTGYAGRMEAALRRTTSVTWHGGLPRSETLARTRTADIALSWRDSGLDESLELSTKLLEYGSAGLPVVLNRTPMHAALLGDDYPMFAATRDEVVDTIARAATDPAVHASAAARTIAAAGAFTVDRAVERTRVLLDRALPAPPAFVARAHPLKVGVASHDLKFFLEIADHLAALPNVELRYDVWEARSRHDEAASRQMIAWADVVICEWAGPNAAWYSRHKRAGQRLIVRVHRVELTWPSAAEIQPDAIDCLVCVSPHYRDVAIEQLGSDPARVTVVPNAVDDLQLDRPKDPDARFHLGVIGITPTPKRFDLALDVLERLRARDPRYRLYAKSKMPWQLPWVWRDPAERSFSERQFQRIDESPAIAGAVAVEPFGPDVALWLRRVGFVLSTSDYESFHLAPAEGAASGAVPVLLPWPGAELIYDRRWIQPDVDAMADRIAAIVDGGTWDEERRSAQVEIRDRYGLGRVLGQWEQVVLGDSG